MSSESKETSVNHLENVSLTMTKLTNEPVRRDEFAVTGGRVNHYRC